MARIFSDGFERGSRGLWWTSINGSFSVVTVASSDVTGFSGTYCISSGGGTPGGNFSTIVLGEQDEIYVAFKMAVDDYYGGFAGIGLQFLDSAGTVCGRVIRSTSGYIQAWLGTSTTLLGTGTIFLFPNVASVIEVRYKPHNTSGVFQVKVGGILEIDVTTGDTTAGLETINRIRLGTGQNEGAYYDDIIVDDADWIGNTKIQGLAVNGAGTTTQFDPSTGANYECVNEIPYSDTDYVYTNVVDEIDTYALTNLSFSPYSIKNVKLIARVARIGAATPANCRLIVRPASTDRLSGSDLPISSTTSEVTAMWELNPEDSAAWEEADITGMEIGIKSLT